jgi:hypothetical protein
LMNIFIRALDATLFVKISTINSDNQIVRILVREFSCILFVCSAFQIVYSWMYNSSVLPKSLRKWISRIADIDEDLLLMLGYFKEGLVEYGKSTGYENTLKEYCQRNNIDPSLADVSKSALISCSQVIHPPHNCFLNVVNKFRKGFITSFGLYLPFYLFSGLISSKSYSWSYLLNYAMKSTLTSSIFLSTFVSSIWSTICICRNKFMNENIGPLLGCVICGWTIFIENQKRRHDLTLYCLPRALHCFLSGLQYQNPRFPLISKLGEFSCIVWSLGILIEKSLYSYDQVKPSVRKYIKFIFVD